MPRIRILVDSEAWGDIYSLVKEVIIEWRQVFAYDTLSDTIRDLC
jgi:hypothetical protein